LPSIFPELTAGGLVVRDAAGNPTNPPAVERAYVPPAAYAITCLETALPSDCTARIEPRQLNAVVSELVALAECFDPNGPWDCNSLRNLCAAFQAWLLTAGVYVGDTPPPAPKPNALWWESDTGFMFIWYNDGNSTQWVQAANDRPVMDGVTIIGTGTLNSPHAVGVVDCGVF
jgi:hypothetical protein